MGEPQVEELEAVARLASAQRQDQLGLVVRFANRPRFAMVEGLPAHCLRVGEPRSEGTRLNSSHQIISYAVFCLKKKKNKQHYKLCSNKDGHVSGVDSPENLYTQ